MLESDQPLYNNTHVPSFNVHSLLYPLMSHLGPLPVLLLSLPPESLTAGMSLFATQMDHEFCLITWNIQQCGSGGHCEVYGRGAQRARPIMYEGPVHGDVCP